MSDFMKEGLLSMPYEPRPIDTSHVQVPRSLHDLQERLAENTHEVWSQGRMSAGWTWGPQRDDARRHHPGLVPYAELSEEEKDFDRRTAMETIKAILALGYTIVEPGILVEPEPDR
ncbi:MAG: hypothetical protein IT428_24310 [Planctomycetaceae bacterium]|nr:hypothetical protein [Planctomycetaceae bacterium]